MQQSAYAMCGLAFSGKSTVAAKVASALGTALISLDAINDERGLHGGTGMTDKQWEETSFIVMDRLRLLLRNQRSVVVDDTFSHRFLRDRCRRVADETGCRFVILFVDTPLSLINERRLANYANPGRHHIDEGVFAHHRDRFQFPTDDEPVVGLRSDRDLAEWLDSERSRHV